jgi:hypothetical protein
MFSRFNNFLLILLIFVYTKAFISLDQQKMNFWSMPKKGANIFNQSVSHDDIKAAKQYGIEFIRLAFDKFPTTCPDFLIGDADNYNGLIEEDLIQLKQILDICL